MHTPPFDIAFDPIIVDDFGSRELVHIHHELLAEMREWMLEELRDADSDLISNRASSEEPGDQIVDS